MSEKTPSGPVSYPRMSETTPTGLINYTEPRMSETTPSGLISYNFISDPVKKAFFETSAPAAGAPQVMYDRADVDINLEAKINQYVPLLRLQVKQYVIALHERNLGAVGCHLPYGSQLLPATQHKLTHPTSTPVKQAYLSHMDGKMSWLSWWCSGSASNL